MTVDFEAWTSDLREGLQELRDLKNLKDSLGKTDEYHERVDNAWRVALGLVRDVKTMELDEFYVCPPEFMKLHSALCALVHSQEVKESEGKTAEYRDLRELGWQAADAAFGERKPTPDEIPTPGCMHGDCMPGNGLTHAPCHLDIFGRGGSS